MKLITKHSTLTLLKTSFSSQLKNIILVAAFISLFSCSETKKETSDDQDTIAKIEEPVIDLLDTIGGKGVFFVELKDSQVVKSPVMVIMGVKGMDVEPAGPVVEMKGHHHIIIDGGPIELGQGVPLDENNLHFGKGQIEAEVKLTPGFHTLTLQFGNGVHASYGSKWSKTIAVKVK